MRYPIRLLIAATVLCSTAASGGAGGSAAGEGESLRLRLNDAIGEPGGVVAVLARTYSSRPVGQGQICGRAPSLLAPDGSQLFTRLIDTQVFAIEEDVTLRARLEDEGEVVVRFNSPSRTINEIDGPVAVFFLELDPGLEPGQAFDLELDLSETFLRGEDGELIPLEPISGELEIREPGDGYSVEPDGDTVRPGEIAEIGVQTFEPLRLRSGQVALSYDPDVTVGPPLVTVNPAHGSVELRVDDRTAGLVVVRFRSPDRDFNWVPGDIIEVEVATDPEVPPGTVTPVEIVPDLTFFVDRAGDMVTLQIEDAETLEFE